MRGSLCLNNVCVDLRTSIIKSEPSILTDSFYCSMMMSFPLSVSGDQSILGMNKTFFAATFIIEYL